MKNAMMIVMVLLCGAQSFGAADDAGRQFFGVACRVGRFAVKRGMTEDGAYICAVAHTLGEYLIREHLQSAADELFKEAQKNKKLNFNLADAAFPITRHFSFDEEISAKLTLSVFVLHQKIFQDASCNIGRLRLVEGLLPFAWPLSCVLPDSDALDISRKACVARSVGLFMLPVKAKLTSSKSLDEVAAAVFKDKKNLNDEDLVVIADTKTWNRRKKAS